MCENLTGTHTHLKQQALTFHECISEGKLEYILSAFLTDDERHQAAECGLLYCRLHVLLARQALENGRPRFKVRPRLHQFVCEIIPKLRAGSRLNPKYTACFADESFIGRMCAIGKSNVHPSTMGLRLLQRTLMQLNSHIVSARR